MDRPLVQWFHFWHQNNPNSSWDSFTLDLIRRFGDRTGGSVFEKMTTMKQEESIEEYVQGFEILVAQASSIIEEQLLGTIQKGPNSFPITNT
ncbi:hypothetical protein CR513_48906, partial [Mucuna pruriens]